LVSKTKLCTYRRKTADSSGDNRQALTDAAILFIVSFAAWVVIERTDACTRFFAYVAANPDMELDSVILAGIFATLGLLIFAYRRWMEAVRAKHCAECLAYNDPLTGLANRRSFVEALERARSARAPFSCLLLDLDNFKQVNDLRGHLVGDGLLQEVCRRLRGTQSGGMLVARLGGDEFGVLISGGDDEQALQLAHCMVARVREPIVIGGRVVEASVSGGMARFAGEATSAEQLLRNADMALYCAKRSGGGTVEVFVEEMEASEQHRAAIVEALRQAIPNGEIVPHYQPLVEVSGGKIVGYEVLSRWTSPTLGSLSPAEFIPVATDAGLINALSGRVLKQACEDAMQWPEPLRISFNIAPHQLCDPLTPLQILAILSNTGLDPRRLELELTEDALLNNKEAALANLRTLKAQGISLALDDFGTGYSSLHHLRTLPFDVVKIDRSYVRDIGTCETARRIVSATIDFTHSFGIPVLAEGVETQQQADVLRTLGCDLGQGWFYGREVPASALGGAMKSVAVADKSGAAA
jgi:diguanylate cyclase (GGDEF)-like protein